MKKNSPVMRKCIACKETYDRNCLLKITKDQNLGINISQGMGRSAYICKTKNCYRDSKFKKKLQKALRSSIDPNLFEIIKHEIENNK